jgi:hypothetical protein
MCCDTCAYVCAHNRLSVRSILSCTRCLQPTQEKQRTPLSRHGEAAGFLQERPQSRGHCDSAGYVPRGGGSQPREKLTRQRFHAAVQSTCDLDASTQPVRASHMRTSAEAQCIHVYSTHVYAACMPHPNTLHTHRLTSLVGLESASSLVYLDVSYNALRSTAGLSHNTRLTTLILNNNFIRSLQGASHMISPRLLTSLPQA